MSDQDTRPTGVRRVARTVVNLLLLVVMAGSALWMVPGSFGYSRYVITGGSMTGTYDKGSIVFEEPVAVDDLRVGDVITYLPPASSGVSTLVTHRIVEIQPAAGGGALFSTQGDHNPDPDPWHFQLTDTAQPVVRASVPYVGWAFIALADRDTRMLVIGGPALLVALGAMGQLVGALRERRPVAPAVA
jgi:signal peptidase